MPSIELGLVTHLQADAGLSSLVGPRVRWGQADPEEPYPYVVCRTPEESGSGINTLDGTSSLCRQRVLFDCWSDGSAEEARAIGNAIESSLVGPRTAIGGVPSAGCEFLRAADGAGKPGEGQGLGPFRRIVELLVWSET
jgi:hypothetical protein